MVQSCWCAGCCVLLPFFSLAFSFLLPSFSPFSSLSLHFANSSFPSRPPRSKRRSGEVDRWDGFCEGGGKGGRIVRRKSNKSMEYTFPLLQINASNSCNHDPPPLTPPHEANTSLKPHPHPSGLHHPTPYPPPSTVYPHKNPPQKPSTTSTPNPAYSSSCKPQTPKHHQSKS